MLRKAILFELRNPFQKSDFLNIVSPLKHRRLEIRFFEKIGFLKPLGNIVRNISH